MKHLFTLALILTTFSYSFSQGWGEEFLQEAIDFETPSNSLILDSSEGNIWQIGQPQKTIFNSARSLPNAIVTDTLHPYPVNNHSWFDIILSQETMGIYYPWNLFIDFYYKLDSDPGKDGGFISVSYDYGATWTNVLNDTIYDEVLLGGINYLDLYNEQDTLFNGEYGISGSVSEWAYSYSYWHELRVKGIQEMPDSILVRFNFISDDVNTNREGWMIDDLRLFAVDLADDVKKTDHLIVRAFPNPSTDYITVELDKQYADVKLELTTLNGRILQEYMYSNTQKIQLQRRGIPTGVYMLNIITNDELRHGVKVFFKN